jgi:hypothetical protein
MHVKKKVMGVVVGYGSHHGRFGVGVGEVALLVVGRVGRMFCNECCSCGCS